LAWNKNPQYSRSELKEIAIFTKLPEALSEGYHREIRKKISLRPGDCTSLVCRDKFFEQNKQRLSPPESSTVSPLFVAKIFFLHVILIKILSFVNYFLTHFE
jgi:hypothetical protein